MNIKGGRIKERKFKMWSILNGGIGRNLFICNFSFRSPTRQDHLQKYFSFFNLMQPFSCISQSSKVFPLRVRMALQFKTITEQFNLPQSQQTVVMYENSADTTLQTLPVIFYLWFSTSFVWSLCFQSILSAVYLEELKYPNDSMNWRKSRMLSWMHSFVENWQWMCRALTKWVNGS